MYICEYFLILVIIKLSLLIKDKHNDITSILYLYLYKYNIL